MRRGLQSSEVKGPALYAVSSGINAFVLAISSLLVAKLVLPEDMGVWQGVALILSYTGFMELGVMKGLNRQYALNRGAGKDSLALEMAQTAGGYTCIWAIANTFVVLAILLFTYLHGSNDKTIVALALLSLPALAQPFNSYYEVIYRSGNDFWHLAQIQFIESAYALASVFLVYALGWAGLFVRYASLVPFGVLLRYLWRPISWHPHFDVNLLISLGKIGIKVIMGGYLYGLLLAADSTLVLARFGQKALGQYSLTSMVQTAITVLPTSLTVIVYSRMAFRFGQTGTVSSLKKLTFLPVICNAVILIIPAVILCILIRPAVEWLLPNYRQGIPAAQWMVVAGYFMCLTTSSTLFTTLNRMREYTLLIALALGLIYLTGWLAAEHWGTIESIAAANALIFAVFALGVNLLAFKFTRTL
jgi:O-antigen/teichoic acid export membrane protein